MPPKSSTTTSKQSSKGSTKPQLEAINNYLAQKPEFDRLLQEEKFNPKPEVHPEESEYDSQIQRAILNMPVLPSEGNAGDSLSDKIGEMKDKLLDSKSKDGNTASVQDHQANPGPVQTQDLGEPASKEELRKRAEELNK